PRTRAATAPRSPPPRWRRPRDGPRAGAGLRPPAPLPPESLKSAPTAGRSSPPGPPRVPPMDRDPLALALPAPLVHVEGLPALPALARSLLSLREGEGRRADDLVGTLEGEPELGARLVRLVRSTRAQGEDVTSLRRAVALLGPRSARFHALA